MHPNPHRRSSLFLIELLFSVFFLTISAAAAVHVFSLGYSFQREAREMELARELFSQSAEVLDGTDGSAEAFLSHLPGGLLEEDSLLYYFDSGFLSCPASEAAYQMQIHFHSEAYEKIADFTFQALSGSIICQQEIRCPKIITLKKEEMP